MAIQGLLKYEGASDQKVNCLKTTISFSRGVRDDKHSRIAHYLDIGEVMSHNKYLGLPTVVGRSKKKPFLFIVDRIKICLPSWMERLLYWAGKKVLIKVAAQAIRPMQCLFKFPKELCQAIQASINRS